ncbi:hypothetical protein [Argonema galeatum]|uniref:hypothetical protein n=1 Tax=Argonema galeatum TaxID=2942762 RepID=UPI0020123730|nr:hypothetical protein [Argonema galeatum]MCL1465972.1 hypothetical protein [Argonema galeatum A003/A1]
MKPYPDELPRASTYSPNQPWSQTAFFNANIKTQSPVSLNPNLTLNSGLTHNYYGIPPALTKPPVDSQILNSQSIQTPSKPDKEHLEANSKPHVSQHLPVILQFLAQQFTSPLPIVFGGVVSLVVIAMLLGPMSGGIRVKLDLEVSPSANQIEKATGAK